MGTGTVVETANAIPYAGKIVTMSFYARVGANFSATSSTINAYVTTGTGTDQNGILGAWTGAATPLSQNFTATTTWQRFSVTGTFASNVTEFYNYVNFTPTGTAGAADYLEVTGIQLEIGSVATPFTRSGGTIQGELAACQRYYWRQTGPGVYARIAGSGIGNTTTQANFVPTFPVTMRTVPTSVDFSTLLLYDTVNLTAVTSLVISASSSTLNSIELIAGVASGLTAFRPYMLANNNNAAGYLGLSAEL